MKAFLFPSQENLTRVVKWAEEEAVNGYYTHNGNHCRVTPLDWEFFPDSFREEYPEKMIPAGGVVTPGHLVYTSCGGNWVCISNEGEVRVAGRRHGLVGSWDTDCGWEYPEGGTLTPQLPPWGHPPETSHDHLKKKAVVIEIASLPQAVKEAAAALKDLSGVRLLRKRQWIKSQIGENRFQQLFS